MRNRNFSPRGLILSCVVLFSGMLGLTQTAAAQTSTILTPAAFG